MSGFVGEGTPLTAQGTVDGTQKATYELPLLGRFVVESVVAMIDASGGGATLPQLTVLDKSGAVIAKKRQTQAIPAGDTGAATWALRLVDDLAAVAAGAQLLGAGPVVGQFVPSGAGTTFFDLDVPNFWTNDPATFAAQVWAAGGPENGHSGIGILKTGTYLVTYSAFFSAQAGFPVANPWTVTVEWTESGGYVILLDLIGAGADQNTGFDYIETGFATWAVYDQVIYEVIAPIPPDTPFILQTKQATGQTLIVNGGMAIQKLNDQVPF